MEMIYAVIKNGVVDNTIVASQSFVNQHYPGAIRIDQMNPIPGVGWSYSNGQFSPPN
jgi:hypothetical protein